MLVAAWILGAISLAGFMVWGRGMYRLFKEKDIPVKRVDRTTTETWKQVSSHGISINHSIVREKGVEVSYGEGMSYGEIEEGLRRKDSGTITFVQLFAGFLCGLMGLISSIGAATVAHGNRNGWFMIGFCVIFTGLFAYIVLQQKLNAARNKPKDDAQAQK